MTNLSIIRFEKELEEVVNRHPEIPLEVTRLIVSSFLRNIERTLERVANEELAKENSEQGETE